MLFIDFRHDIGRLVVMVTVLWALLEGVSELRPHYAKSWTGNNLRRTMARRRNNVPTNSTRLSRDRSPAVS
jgi:hypothetical protein